MDDFFFFLRSLSFLSFNTLFSTLSLSPPFTPKAQRKTLPPFLAFSRNTMREIKKYTQRKKERN